MPSITVYGASDDLVTVDGCPGGDEFNVDNGHFEGDLIAPGGDTVHVTVRFTDEAEDGAWKVTLGAAENVPYGNWPTDYQTRYQHAEDDLVIIDAPPGTRLDNVEIP